VQALVYLRPAQLHATVLRQCGIGSVAQQVDQRLLQLIRIEPTDQRRSFVQCHLQALFQTRHPRQQRRQLDRAQAWRRQPRKRGIPGHETIQGFGAVADHTQAALHILAPVVGQMRACSEVGQGGCHRLDRRQRIVEFVPQHADQALPGLPLFLAQGAREIGDHQQIVGQPALAKPETAHIEAARAAGESAAHHRCLLDVQAIVQAEHIGRVASDVGGPHLQQALAGRVDQMQLLAMIETEHRDIDGGNDLAQQGARLFHPQPLLAQGVRQCVDLPHHIADGIAAVRARAAQTVIALAQGFQQIGQGIQRKHHALAQARNQSERKQCGEADQHPQPGARLGALPQQPRDQQQRRQQCQRDIPQQTPFEACTVGALR